MPTGLPEYPEDRPIRPESKRAAEERFSETICQPSQEGFDSRWSETDRDREDADSESSTRGFGSRRHR